MAGIHIIREETINVKPCSTETKEETITTNLPPIQATIIGSPCYIFRNNEGKIVAIIDKDTLYVSAAAEAQEIVNFIETVYFTIEGIDAIVNLEGKIMKIQKLLDLLTKINRVNVLLTEEDKKKLIEKIEREIEAAKSDDVRPVEVIVSL